MRVLYVANRFRGVHGDVGGAESAIEDVLRMARAGGHEVALATVRPTHSDARQDVPIHVVDLLEDAPPRALTRRIAGAKLGGLPVDPRARTSFHRVLERVAPDVVQFGNLKELTFAPLAAAAERGLPTLFAVYDYACCCPKESLIDHRHGICHRYHGPWCLACLRHDRPVGRLEQLGLSMRGHHYRRWMARFDRVVALSEHSRGVCTAAGVPGERIRVIPLLAPSVDDIAPPPAEVRDAVFVGWIQRRKGLAVAVEAMATVCRALPETRLHVIGEDAELDYTRAVRGRIHELGIEDRIVFHGRLTRSQTLDAVQRSAVLVLPEQWENVSPVILAEAFALGVPVVASRVGGIGELLSDGINGYAVPRERPDAFAAAMLRVLRDRARRDSMSDAARAAVQEIRDPAHIAQRWNDLYDELTGGGP